MADAVEGYSYHKDRYRIAGVVVVGVVAAEAAGRDKVLVHCNPEACNCNWESVADKEDTDWAKTDIQTSEAMENIDYY